MIERGYQITEMMGYTGTEDVFDAIGKGELILVKIPTEKRLELSRWLRDCAGKTLPTGAGLNALLEDIADAVELALELERYPMGSDICDLDLPHGWPSYCEKTL